MPAPADLYARGFQDIVGVVGVVVVRVGPVAVGFEKGLKADRGR